MYKTEQLFLSPQLPTPLVLTHGCPFLPRQKTPTRCLYLLFISISIPPFSSQPTANGFQPNQSECAHFYITNDFHRAKSSRYFSSLLLLEVSLAFKIVGCPPFLQIICVLSFSDSIFCSHLFFHCISMTSSSQPPMTALHFNALQGSVLGHLSLFCILHLINSTYSYKLNGLPSIC